MESAVYGAHLKGENSYDQESYKGGTAFYRKRGKRSDRPGGRSSRLSHPVPMCGKVESPECCHGIRNPDV